MITLDERPDGSCDVVMQNEPAFCHGLPYAPASMPTAMRNGFWLVLLVVLWSSPDRMAIGTALSAAKELNGSVQLGVGVFDSHEQIRGWCPSVKAQYVSPVWLVLNNGELVHEATGAATKEQVVEMLEPYMKPPSTD